MSTVFNPSRWSIAGVATASVLGLVAIIPSTMATAAGSSSCAPSSTKVKTVTNTNNSGAGSLRAAIFKVNNPSLAWDTINFKIPGAGNHVIAPLTNLPSLTAPVTIDGYSQPGSSQASPTTPADLGIVIDARGLNRGLRLATHDSVAKGLNVRNANAGSGDGIVVVGDCNTIAGNYVGVMAGGQTGAANVDDGITVTGDSNTVGGSLPADRNVVSANGGTGVLVSGGGNTVAGNLIGTNDDGNAALGNGAEGVSVTGDSNTVGGTVAGTQNVVSGNGGVGVAVAGSSNTIAANRVGTNEDGTAALGNSGGGIEIGPGAGNVVGGALANLVSGNVGSGVIVDATASGSQVLGNLVGTDADALADIGNSGDGVLVNAATTVISQNVIAGNGAAGIDAHADGVLIFSNQIGVVTTATGPAPLSNDRDGIIVRGDGAVIGDIDAGNTVAANGRNGIRLEGDDQTVSDNFIGTDSTGALGLGNGRDGVFLHGKNSLIGGATQDLGNVSSGNQQAGVHVVSPGGPHIAAFDRVIWNLIGTAPNGADPIANTGDGVLLQATQVQVTTNTIWFNAESGIEVLQGTQNPLVGNRITLSGQLGIDLFPLGVTPNDVLDPDTGANDLLNVPLIMSATSNASGTLVTWRMVQGLPGTKMQFEFFANSSCDGSGSGEALRPLGTAVRTTDAMGNLTATVQLTGTSVPGEVASATATLVPITLGPTSELSPCLTIS